MKYKATLKAIAVIILSLVFISMASPSYAQGNGFVETFDDATLSGWEKVGDAIVESGVLKMSPPAMLLKRGTWSNITLTVIFRFETDCDFSGLSEEYRPGPEVSSIGEKRNRAARGGSVRTCGGRHY